MKFDFIELIPNIAIGPCKRVTPRLFYKFLKMENNMYNYKVFILLTIVSFGLFSEKCLAQNKEEDYKN